MKRFRALFGILLAMFFAFSMVASFARADDEEENAETLAYQQQIMNNAYRLLTTKRPESYKTIPAYITWINNQKYYYESTLLGAEIYSEKYNFMNDWGTSFIHIGVSALSGDIAKVGEEVLAQYLNYAVNEIQRNDSVELSAEQFIYSQARNGIDGIKIQLLYDINGRMVNGRFASVTDAIDFIMIYQGNEACLAAAEMGRQYYYDQINKPWYEYLRELTIDFASSQLRSLFLNSPISKFTASQITDWVKDLFGMLNTYYNSEYVQTWQSRLRELEAETERLLRYTGTQSGVIVPSYSVVFDPNGGSVGTAQRFYTQGMPYGYLPIAYRFGYDFLGWYDGNDNLYTDDTICDQSGEITLTAKWSRTILEVGHCGPTLNYILYGDGLLEISGSGEMTGHDWTDKYAGRVGRVILPDGLVSIYEGAFQNCKYLHEINIPESVTSIGNNAFSYSGLLSLKLPENLNYLGWGFIAGTSIMEISIPGTVDIMQWGWGSGIFTDSYVEKVTFESGITVIPPFTCYNAKELTTLTLPNTLEEIGDCAFGNTAISSMILPEGIKILGSSMLEGNTELADIFIPKTVTYGYYPFSNSAVSSVILEDGIETIPDGFLAQSNIMTFVVPDSVTKIGMEAFRYTSSLQEISISNSVTSIENNAFADSGLLSLRLPENLNYLGWGFIANTQIKEIIVPGTVSTMEWGRIGGVFTESNVEKIIFESGITVISPNTCYDAKKLTTVILPDTLEEIGYGAFENTAIASMSLPEGIKTLGSNMLYGNTRLHEINIPKTVTAGNCAFWGSKVNRVTIENGMEIIPDGLLACSEITTFTVPDGVKTIGAEAFMGTSALQEIYIPNSVTAIENNAFVESGLRSLKLPESVIYLGWRLIADTPITEIVVPGTVNTLDWGWNMGVFSDSNVEKVVFEPGITVIPSCSFYDAKKLTTVILPNTLIEIGDNAFENTALKSIVIPESVIYIGDNCFDGLEDDFIIYGYTGSTAQQYAMDNDIIFISIGEMAETECPSSSPPIPTPSTTPTPVMTLAPTITETGTITPGIIPTPIPTATAPSGNIRFEISMPDTLVIGNPLTVKIGLDGSQSREVSVYQGTEYFGGVTGYSEELTLDEGVFETAGTYTIQVRTYIRGTGSITKSQDITVTGIRPAAPSVSVVSNEVDKDSEAEFVIIAQKMTEVRYKKSWFSSYTRYAAKDVDIKGNIAQWKDKLSADDQYINYMFSVKVNGVWSAYSAPITVHVKAKGTLDIPVIADLETIQAGVPISLMLPDTPHATSYQLSLWGTSHGKNISISVTAKESGEVLLARYGLNGGSYGLSITAFGEGYASSTYSSTITVEGECPVPTVKLPEGNLYAGETVYVEVAAENLECVSFWGQSYRDYNNNGDIYLCEGDSIKIPIRLEIYRRTCGVRARIDGRWSDLIEFNLTGELREELEEKPEISLQSSYLLGNDVLVSINNLREGVVYTYNVTWNDGKEPRNVVYECEQKPINGIIRIPGYSFEFAGSYTITINEYLDDGFYSYVGESGADITILENPNLPDAPVVRLLSDTVYEDGNAYFGIETRGADRLYVYWTRVNEPNNEGDPLPVELDSTETYYRYDSYIPNDSVFYFSLGFNGQLSRVSEPVRVMVTHQQDPNPLEKINLYAPVRSEYGKDLVISWDSVPGAENYYLAYGSSTVTTYERTFGPDTLSCTIPAECVPVQNGYTGIWFTANAINRTRSAIYWDIEVYDLSNRPTLKVISMNDEKLTLEVSNVYADRLQIRVNGEESGYVFHTANEATERFTISTEEYTRMIVEIRNYSLDRQTLSAWSMPLVIEPENGTIIQKPDFVLPSGLRKLEEAAFENGSFKYVVVPESVSSIPARVFAECRNLVCVQISGKNTSIDPTAFSEDTGLILIAPKDSNAESFAEENGFLFMPLSND